MRGLEPDAPIIRTEVEGKSDNIAYEWESGDAGATNEVFASADRIVTLETHYPRSHPAPLETCGIVADVSPVTGAATLYLTSQAPHAHRTLFAIVAGLPEQNIRIISPDLGGASATRFRSTRGTWSPRRRRSSSANRSSGLSLARRT